MPPVFEFDPAKSAANKAKHGIDFVEAQALWNDDDLFVYPSRFPDEPRFIATGEIDGVRWSAILTPRGADIRFISVRRARKEESDVYEDHKRRRD